MKKLFDRLNENIDSYTLKDQIELKKIASSIKRRCKRKQPIDRLLSALEERLDQAERRGLKNIAENLKLAYPDNLPISARVDEIKSVLSKNQVIIVCGSTGSGKTTQLPKIALDCGLGRSGRIGCTQPRRLAATAMAKRVAQELNVGCGDEVGFQVRFNKHCRDNTVVKFMTDGILLSETQHDPDLRQYDCLIIDEAHERSLNIDFILGYLKRLKKKRPEFKIIISSATLDADNFSKFFDDAPILTIEGRTFPVEDFFLPPEQDEDLSQHIARAVNWISEVDRRGDILVFLPGEREIRDAKDMLEGRNIVNTRIIPLFGRLSNSEQQAVFSPGKQRRIILSTNVAETSITIPNIHYVIDSGLVRLSRYNPRNHIQALQIEQVSQASARQRRGRCGRIADGICVYLYDEETLSESPEFTDPEICRTSLAGVILQMTILKLGRIDDFPFLDPPQSALVREGYQTLGDIQAVSPDGAITSDGLHIARIPLDPHIAKMLVTAYKREVLPEVIIIAAYLSMQDPCERPLEKQAEADRAHAQWQDGDSDFISIMNLWKFIQRERSENPGNSALRRFCRGNFLSFIRVREWFNLAQDLCRSAREMKWGKIDIMEHKFGTLDYEKVHKSILSGVPANIARYDKEEKIYAATRNRKFFIFPGSTLCRKKTPEQWVMAFTLVSTTRVFARETAAIKAHWLEDVAPHLCKSTYDNIRWEKKSGFVYAREMVISGGLIIHKGRSVHYGSVKKFEAREIFIREAMVFGELFSRQKWLKKHQKMIDDIKLLEDKIRRPEALLDLDAVYEHFNQVLPSHVCSTQGLDRWLHRSRTDINMAIQDAMIEQLHPIHLEDYPDSIIFSGHEFSLRYAFAPGEAGDGISILARDDEMNLLLGWALEWLVPGFLPEKVEAMIKSLPKSLRILCNPAADTTAEFVAAVRDNKIFCERSLNNCLAEFLAEFTRSQIKADDFDMDRLPEYMFMKVAETDAKGNIVKYHREVPESSLSGSMLSSIVTGAADHIQHDLVDWPAGDIPPAVILNGKTEVEVYPALYCDEDSIHKKIFLDREEAEYEHLKALVELFKKLYPKQTKYIRKLYKLPAHCELTFYFYDHKRIYRDDFFDSVIAATMTNDGQLDIRDENTFRNACQTALENMADTAERRTAQLDDILNRHDQVKALLDKLDDRAMANRQDIEEQLQFLFRPGCLRDNDLWQNYSRYLRALQLRLERLIAAPFKDTEKLQTIEYFIDRFKVALMVVDDFNKNFALVRFWKSLEELRISTFAPDIQTTEKISVKKLQKKWDDLSLSSL